MNLFQYQLANQRFFDTEKIDIILGSDLLEEGKSPQEHLLHNTKGMFIKWTNYGYTVSDFLNPTDFLSYPSAGTGWSKEKERRMRYKKRNPIVRTLVNEKIKNYHLKTEAFGMLKHFDVTLKKKKKRSETQI